MGRYPRRRAPRDDSGFTLIELSVSLVLLAILGAMVTITISFVLQESVAQTAATQSASNAETSLWTLKVPLRYAETPYTASVANPAAGGVTSTTPCWGSSSPSFDPVMPAWGPAGNAQKLAGGASYGMLGSPADDGLLVAHDYDIVFSAPQNYKPYTTAPNIYRLWINPTTCTNSTALGGGGCTLELDNYGPNPFADCSWPGFTLPSNPPPNGNSSTCLTSPR